MPFFSPSVSGTVTVTGTVTSVFDTGMKYKGWTDFSLNGNGLQNLAAGNATAFALVDISAEVPLWEGALLYLQTRMGGAAPAAGASIEYYMVRNTGTDGQADDNVANAGVAPGANFWDQADLIAAFNVTATASKFYRRTVTLDSLGPLGNARWGIGARNGTSAALQNTAGDHVTKHNMFARHSG